MISKLIYSDKLLVPVLAVIRRLSGSSLLGSCSDRRRLWFVQACPEFSEDNYFYHRTDNEKKSLEPRWYQNEQQDILDSKMPHFSSQVNFCWSEFTLWALITPAPLTPALITSVSNCAEYKKVFISAFNGNIRQEIS